MKVTETSNRESSNGGVLKGLQSLMQWSGAGDWSFRKAEDKRMPRTSCTKQHPPVCEDCEIPLFAMDVLLWSDSHICSDCRLRRKLLASPNAYRPVRVHHGLPRN